jgi:hypothetical protein
VVRSLERCPGIDVDEAAGGHVLGLRRIADAHQERPG